MRTVNGHRRANAAPNTSIHLRRVGTGEPLLLVHGIGSSEHAWDPVIADLANHRELIAIDLPGYGRSPQDGVAPTVDGFADALADLCTELGMDRPHVAGHSLGGAVALELGRRGLARSVVAFAPIGFWGATGVPWLQGVLRATRTVNPIVRPILPRLVRRPVGRIATMALFHGKPTRLAPRTIVEDADRFMAAEAFDATCASFSNHVFTDPGALADIPVTVAWGSRDACLPAWSQARRACAALPAARHVRLPGCGHFVMADDPVSCRLLLLDRWHLT